MSFGTHARKVRDPALPLAHRAGALRQAVTLYQPLGWHTTLGFVESVAGPYRRDEAALLRALDVLEESRSAWRAEVRSYDRRRTRAKRDGRRTPGPDDVNPFQRPVGWHGPRRRAASLYALRERHVRHPVGAGSLDAQVHALVAASLAADGVLTADETTTLATVVAALERRLRADDPRRRFGAHQLLRTLRLVDAARPLA